MKKFFRTLSLQIVGAFFILQTLHAQTINIPELNLTFNRKEVELSDTAEAYIRSVVNIMRKEAIHRHSLNLDNIQQAIRYYANGAQVVEDTHQAIKKVMPLLKDHHSYFMTSEYVSKSLGLKSADIEVIKSGSVPHIDPPQLEALKKQLNYPHGRMVGDRIGYLSVPAFNNLYYEAMTLFADSLQRIIQALDRQNLKGWIVDLRDNDGGADLPMITGLGPLLDSDNVYYCVEEGGLEKGRTFYKNGGYYNVDSEEAHGEALIQSTVNYQLARPGAPVAILTGRKTASSAEAVAAIFAGQPNVKLIGGKTNGLTSVNSFNFLEDNSVLNLTIGYYANRHHQVYKQGIVPDLLVSAENTSGKTELDDAVLQKAVEWLNNYSR